MPHFQTDSPKAALLDRRLQWRPRNLIERDWCTNELPTPPIREKHHPPPSEWGVIFHVCAFLLKTCPTSHQLSAVPVQSQSSPALFSSRFLADFFSKYRSQTHASIQSSRQRLAFLAPYWSDLCRAGGLVWSFLFGGFRSIY